MTKSKQNKKKRPARSSNKPPQLSSNVVVNHTYRFTSSSGNTTFVTPVSMLCAAGSFTSVLNTSVVSIFGALKVKRVTVWAPPASQGAVSTCSIDWAGSGAASQGSLEVSDTTNSVSTPAKISSAPPRGSLADFWQNAAQTNSLFGLTAPVGSIIDVQLSLIFQDADNAPATTTVATAAIGVNYFLSLDPNATHRYVPVSLSTTT
jgi:hypothetical protein